MRRLCGSPFCGPALECHVALVIQPRESRRAFRHESVAPQRIRVAIACPTSTAPPRRRVLSVIIDLRDNQTACLDSLFPDRESVTPELLMRNAGVSKPRIGCTPFALSSEAERQ